MVLAKKNNQRLLPLTLAAFGLLIVAPGPVLAQDTSEACGAEPTALDIGYGDFIDCTLQGSIDSDLFTWQGTAGETAILRVRALSGSVEPCFTIFDPSNSEILQSSCANNNFLQELSFQLPSSGTYTASVQDGRQDEAGDYQLLLERLAPVSTSAAELSGFGLIENHDIEFAIDLDFYTFHSAADETFNIQARALSGSVEPCLSLFDPAGNEVAASSCANNTFVQEISGFQPQTRGVYLLQVEDGRADEAGNYDLTVQCLFGTCPDPIFFDHFESTQVSRSQL